MTKKRKHNTVNCPHPPARLYSWVARDDTKPRAIDCVVVVCRKCGEVLQGAAEEVKHEEKN